VKSKTFSRGILTRRRAGGFSRRSVRNVRGMRRQGEIRGKACSHAEGQEISGEHRFDLFGKTDASKRCALAVSGKYERPKHFFSFCLQVFESAEHLANRNLHPPKGRRF
jgi:hypothetical protein